MMIPSKSYFNLTEGEMKNFTCVSFKTRPQVNITWYLNETSIPTSNVEFNYDLEGDTFTTTSTVTILGTRDHGNFKTLTCSVKEEGGAVHSVSNTTTVHFFCKADLHICKII